MYFMARPVGKAIVAAGGFNLTRSTQHQMQLPQPFQLPAPLLKIIKLNLR